MRIGLVKYFQAVDRVGFISLMLISLSDVFAFVFSSMANIDCFLYDSHFFAL